MSVDIIIGGLYNDCGKITKTRGYEADVLNFCVSYVKSQGKNDVVYLWLSCQYSILHPHRTEKLHSQVMV